MSRVSDKKLLRVATEFRAGILDGCASSWMCFAVCTPLAAYLDYFHGIKTKVVETDLGEMNHVWLQLSDGRALDPTADQFNAFFPEMNLPPVYLGAPLAIHGDHGQAGGAPPEHHHRGERA